MTKGEFSEINFTVEKKYWDNDLLRKLEFWEFGVRQTE